MSDPTVDVGNDLVTRSRPYARGLWVLVWVVASIWPLNLAAYHYWAAGGPPSPNPEWHEAWGNVFLAAGLACWAVGGFGVWFMRKRPPVRFDANTTFPAFIAVWIMGVAIWAVPGPGRLVLLAPVIIGAVWAFVRLRHSARRK